MISDSTSSLLQVSNIEVFYGKSQALFDVSLTINPGEVIALMGRNGVGKSTTIRAICNLTPPLSGTISLEGESLSKLPTHTVAQKGIGLVPEGRRCFPNLTVEENLLATERKGNWTLEKVHSFFRVSVNVANNMQQHFLAVNNRCSLLDEPC